MSRGNPSDWLANDRPVLDLPALYNGWLCRAVSIGGRETREAPTAWRPASRTPAPPDFIWAIHPS